MLLKRRDLLLYCFDPQHARAIGLSVRTLHYGLLVLLSLTIVASLKAVGIILVVAMLVAPGAVAYLLSDSFDRMLVIASAVAIGSSVARHARELPHQRRDGPLHRADPDGHFHSRLPVRATPRPRCGPPRSRSGDRRPTAGPRNRDPGVMEGCLR